MPTFKRTQNHAKIWLLMLASLFILLAFSANSLLVRLALRMGSLSETHGLTDAGFVLIRMLTGVGALLLVHALRGDSKYLSKSKGFTMMALSSWTSWGQGLVLFLYMAAFSWAYYELDAGVGALVLFMAAQLTMMGVAWRHRETFSWMAVAFCVLGLIGFLWPTDVQSYHGSLSAIFAMLMAGMAWGCFSVLGRGQSRHLLMITQAFICGSVFAIIWWLFRLYWIQSSHSLPAFGVAWLGLDRAGLWSAIVSGALASGLGYAFWYWLRDQLPVSVAAAIQLLVPVMTALLGWLWLGESMTLRQLIFGSALLLAVLGLSYSAKTHKHQRA